MLRSDAQPCWIVRQSGPAAPRDCQGRGCLMCPTRCAAPLVALLACWSLSGPAAEEKPPLRALEQAVEAAVKKAEPSIACILVSRSQLYCRFERRPRPGMSEEVPGRLGGFDRPRFPPGPWRKDDEHWR